MYESEWIVRLAIMASIAGGKLIGPGPGPGRLGGKWIFHNIAGHHSGQIGVSLIDSSPCQYSGLLRTLGPHG